MDQRPHLLYAPAIRELLRPPRSMPLGPGSPNREAEGQLRRLTCEACFPAAAGLDREMAQACLAGLWLLHDFLDESHRLSQELSDRAGAYWHGIMHRREPDPGNAKYWFRRVGRHVIFPALAAEALELAQAAQGSSNWDQQAAFLLRGDWDAMAWIDLCESARRGAARSAGLCEAIGQREWLLLFEYCYQGALGNSNADCSLDG